MARDERIYWDEICGLDTIVKHYYLDHWSLKRLADHLGVAATSLMQHMRRHGLPLRQRPRGEYIHKHGPPCPACGSNRSKVVWTKPKADHYRRHRRCEQCGSWFYTEELTCTKQREAVTDA